MDAQLRLLLNSLFRGLLIFFVLYANGAIHEAGHAGVAKFLGVGVKSVSITSPLPMPTIEWHSEETDYQIEFRIGRSLTSLVTQYDFEDISEQELQQLKAERPERYQMFIDKHRWFEPLTISSLFISVAGPAIIILLGFLMIRLARRSQSEIDNSSYLPFILGPKQLAREGFQFLTSIEMSHSVRKNWFVLSPTAKWVYFPSQILILLGLGNLLLPIPFIDGALIFGSIVALIYPWELDQAVSHLAGLAIQLAILISLIMIRLRKNIASKNNS